MIITNLFFPLSGVKKRPRANPAPSRENTIPHPRSRSVNIWLIYLQVLYSSHNPKHKIKLIYLQVLCSSHNPKHKIKLIYLQVLYSSHNPKHKVKLIYLQVLCSSHNPKYKIRFSRFSTLPIILNTRLD